MPMAYSGTYIPQNPGKYKGNLHLITWRSTWELKLFKFCDVNPDVLEWSSEEVIVPYRSPLDRRTHRYFIDVWLKTKDGRQVLVEVKPEHETRPPNRRTKKAVAKYLVNSAKWEAARAYAERRGMQFMILTEHQLGIT